MAPNKNTSKVSDDSALRILVQDPALVPRTRVTMGISGITCAACVNAIEGALRELPGVTSNSVNVNMLTGTGTAEFSGATTQDVIKVKIENAGYDVDYLHAEKLELEGHKKRDNFEKKAAFLVTVQISGMTSASCAAMVQDSVKEIDGVDKGSVEVDLVTSVATFTYRGENVKTIKVKIAGVIKKLDYVVESVNIVEQASSDNSADSSVTNKDLVTTCFEVSGMTCSACVQGVEKRLLSEPGITKAQVNLITKLASVTYDPTLVGSRAIAKLVTDLGYESKVVQDHSIEQQRRAMRNRMRNDQNAIRRRFIWALRFAVPTFILSMVVMMALPESAQIRMAMEQYIVHGLSLGDLFLFLLATPVQFWLAIPFYTKAYRSLRYLHTANMETLVSLGTTVAYFASLGSIIAAMASPNEDPNMKIEFFETSVFLITFVTLGKWLESLAKGKMAEAITSLMDLQPATAILVNLRTGVSGRKGEEEVEIPVAELQVGDLVKVLPGQRIPCDGKVYRGETAVDESMLTGESIPVIKSSGKGFTFSPSRLSSSSSSSSLSSSSSSPSISSFSSSSPSSEPASTLFTGTINVVSPILMRATHVGSDTTLSHIVQLVQDAQTSPKAPIEVFADKISAVFVPVVIVGALATFAIWSFLGSIGAYPDSWVPAGEPKPIFSLLFAISVLVISCPCGLGLASPTAVMVGTGVAAKYGVFIKGGGQALETMRGVDTIVFDKTGTLTQGRPVVTDWWTFEHTEKAISHVFWNVLHRVTSSSLHPLSRAIAKKAFEVVSAMDEKMDAEGDGDDADEASPKKSPAKVEIVNSKEIPGRGLMATVVISSDAPPLVLPGYGEFREFKIYLGNTGWMDENGTKWADGVNVTKRVGEMRSWQEEGKSNVMVAIEPIVADLEAHPILVAQIAIADVSRPESREVVSYLKHHGYSVWMLTGDNVVTAWAVARTLDINKVLAGVKPEQKCDAIKKLQGFGGIVAMVGDGTNDSPALAQADVGISVGSATDVAIEAAGVVLSRNQLLDLITLLDLSRAVVKRIHMNFGWVFVYNTVAIPIAAGAFFPVIKTQLPPVYAGLAMVMSSVSVIGSSLLLRRYRPPKEALEARGL